jgi:putative transposase
MGTIFFGEEDRREIWTVPHTPVSNPFVERLIGSIRREYLDHVPFLTQIDLEHKLSNYKDYYNTGRVHRSLGGKFPKQYAEEQHVITCKSLDLI